MTKRKSMQRGVEWGQTSPMPFSLGAAPMDSHRRRRPISAETHQANGVRPRQRLLPGAAPQFATMTPWGILSPDQFRPAGPPALDSEQYLVEFDEVKLMGSATSELRTADETDACLFWDSTSGNLPLEPCAQSTSARTAGFDLSENARLLATLNLAIADALIACWDAKYHLRVLAAR